MSFAAVLDRIDKAQNPYPGLRPFETQEFPLFFGRDQQVAELVTRLSGADIAFAFVNEISDLLGHAQLQTLLVDTA